MNSRAEKSSEVNDPFQLELADMQANAGNIEKANSADVIADMVYPSMDLAPFDNTEAVLQPILPIYVNEGHNVQQDPADYANYDPMQPMQLEELPPS